MLLAALLAQGCARPEEKIERLRSYHKATLSGFTVLQEPAAGALKQDVRLDLTLSRAVEGEDGGAREALPGITVDVFQLDGIGEGGREKRRWRIWIDGPELGSGPQAEVHPEVQNVDYRPGDRFGAEIRPVAPAERGEYREFLREFSP